MQKHHKYKHGMSGTRPYNIWAGVWNRCNNQKVKMYQTYGAVGIKLSEEWHTFSKFWEDMEGTYFEGATIDRIDNNKGYSKENCRWATKIQQAINKRTTHVYEHEGKKLTIRELAEMAKIPYETMFTRLRKYKWTLSESITTPVSYGNRYRKIKS